MLDNESKRFVDHGVDFSDELFEMSRDFLMNLDYNDERLFEEQEVMRTDPRRKDALSAQLERFEAVLEEISHIYY